MIAVTNTFKMQLIARQYNYLGVRMSCFQFKTQQYVMYFEGASSVVNVY